jgi:hypothetical protein
MSDSFTNQVSGFKTERDFTRHLCHEIIRLSQDDDLDEDVVTNTLRYRLDSLRESADSYLNWLEHVSDQETR